MVALDIAGPSLARRLAPELTLAGVGDELRRDAPLFAVIGLYCLASLIFGMATGSNGLNIAIYLPLWLGALGLFWLAWIVAVETVPAIRDDPGRPLAALGRRIQPRITPRLVAGAVLYVALSLFYGAFTLTKSALPDVRAFDHDVMLANLDAAIHFGADPWRLLHPVLGHEPVTRAFEIIYGSVWGYLLFIIPLLICSARRLAHLRLRFVLSLIVAWIVLGNGVAAAFLSGGPVYYGALTGDETRFAELTDYLAFSAGLPQSASDYQAYLWAWFQSGQPGPGTGISAFPSIHVATATLLALTAGKLARWAGALGWIYVLVILTGSVHLGWHYAIDGYLSIPVTWGIWLAMGWLAAKLERPAAPA